MSDDGNEVQRRNLDGTQPQDGQSWTQVEMFQDLSPYKIKVKSETEGNLIEEDLQAKMKEWEWDIRLPDTSGVVKQIGVEG